MAKTMEHLSEFVFINVANMTLARRDAYLAHVKAGIKQDTLAALRQAPLHLTTLFPDRLLKRTEEDISQFENKGRSTHPSFTFKKDRYYPYRWSAKSKEQRSAKPASKNMSSYSNKRKGKASHQSSCLAKGHS